MNGGDVLQLLAAVELYVQNVLALSLLAYLGCSNFFFLNDDGYSFLFLLKILLPTKFKLLTGMLCSGEMLA